MGKWKSKKLTDEDIARLHIKELPTDKLEKILEFIDALKKWRSAEKLHSTYFEGTKTALENTGNNKIYFDYRLEGTVTGRLSCGAYKAYDNLKSLPLGISFHTLPRAKENSIRECCISPDNYVFITSDFKQMELRVLAHVANDNNLIKAFQSGEDPHVYTASLAFEKDIKEVTKDERQLAKSGSFLIVYGGGPWKLSKTANISLKAAEDTINRIKMAYPGIFIWMEEVKEYLYKHAYVKSIFNRRRNLPDIHSKVLKIRDKCIRQGINFIIQSSASDIGCYCLLDIANELEARNLDARVVGMVHDSIEVISSREDLEESLQVIQNKMTNYPLLRSLGFNFKTPIEIDCEIGRSFAGSQKINFTKNGSIINRECLSHVY